MKKQYLLGCLLLLAHIMQGQCDFQISGQVLTFAGEPYSEANIQLILDDGNVITTTTDVMGNYSVNESVSNDFSFHFEIEKNSNFLDGVTTLDMVIIQRHILSIQPFTVTENIPASDVNNDGFISVSDLLILRRLILGIITELPTSNLIAFPKFATSNQASELQVENCTVTNSNGPYDLTVLKRGDVNDSWTHN